MECVGNESVYADVEVSASKAHTMCTYVALTAGSTHVQVIWMAQQALSKLQVLDQAELQINSLGDEPR